MSNEETSRSLIRRVQAHEQSAWDLLVRLYGPTVYDWARASGVQEADAQDVMQDVFQNLLKHIDQFGYENSRSSFRGWLWTVTRNQVRLKFRNESGRPVASGGTDAWQQLQAAPDQAASLQEQEQEPDPERTDHGLLHRAMDLIRAEYEPRTWTAFWRVVVDAQSPTDVASETGLSAGAVRQAKYRVLCRLRELLQEGLASPDTVPAPDSA